MPRTLNISEKACLECGRIFKPKNGFQKYCEGPHHTSCIICGKDIEYTCSPKEKPKYCSQACINEGKRRNVKKKYGVDNVSELASVKKKISERNKSKEVAAKRKATCLEKYGVDNVAKNDSIKKRMIAKMSSKEYLENRKLTCRSKYGFDSPMQNPSIKKKRHDTCIARYNFGGRPQSESDYKAKMVDPSRYDNYMQFKEDPRAYVGNHFKHTPTISELERDLGVTNTPIYDTLIKFDCRDIIQHSYSNMEVEVYEYLKSIDPDINVIRNDRTQIKPLELDLYLPDYKLGIECNPTSTHNSSIQDFWSGEIKNYRYHQIKSKRSKEAGIFLFHIFGYEWKFKQAIIKSMIRNLLNKTETSLGARLTHVCNISNEECKEFLNNNHRQGNASSKIRLGLKLNSSNELVAVMTFNKLRSTLGVSKRDTKNTWELTRFCSKLNTQIIGGASKLFKYFVTTMNPDKVVSFSDIAHTSGKLYEILGFQKVSVSAPNYVWVDYYDTKFYTRVRCQKRFLKKLLNDENLDLSKTEKQIMEEHGFLRVYDSGVIRWEYT